LLPLRTISLQFYSFMFGGFAWNSGSLLDMVGNPSAPQGQQQQFNPSIVREVMYLLMFPSKLVVPPHQFHVMMDLLTSVTCTAELATMGSGGGGSSDPTLPTPRLNSSLARSSSEATLVNGNAGNAGEQVLATSAGTGAGAGAGGAAAQEQQLAKAEKILWALLIASGGGGDDSNKNNSQSSSGGGGGGGGQYAVPSKGEAATCLRIYRRALQAASWKPDAWRERSASQVGLLNFVGGSAAAAAAIGASVGGGRGGGAGAGGDADADEEGKGRIDASAVVALEVEEVFVLVNMLSVLCKAIVLAHKSYEKKLGVPSTVIGSSKVEPQCVSYEVLFQALAVGTKSDVANSVLECLSSCTYIWKRRFDGNLLKNFKDATLLLKHQQAVPQAAGAAVGPLAVGPLASNLAGRKLMLHTIMEANKRFLLQVIPTVPASAVFQILTWNLPLPQTVYSFIQRLFSH
jgi:hypothetical protein